MPDLNLFLFIFLALAGVVAFYLYHLDFSDGETGRDPSEQCSARTYNRGLSSSVRIVRTARRTSGLHPAAFFDVSDRCGMEESDLTGILTDFMAAAPDSTEDVRACSGARCA